MSSSLYTRPHTKNWTEIRIDSGVNSLKRALIQLKKTLDETLNEKLSQTVDVTLDPDTANPRLILSDDGKQVSDGDIWQDVPENPKRFDMIQDRTKKTPEIKRSVEQRKPRGANDCPPTFSQTVGISKWMIISLGVLLVAALMILILPKQYTTVEGLDFVQKFAVDVTLDPDTANPYLILSDDGKQVSGGGVWQDVPENPKRFDTTLCVLAKQGFSSGRFYYEVQVKGKTWWYLGVARESSNRKEGITRSPEDGFWTVVLVNEDQYFAWESPLVSLSLRVKPEKVGVFVDYEEGLVSFYDVESRSHIYSFTGQTFTDKLYPYFSPWFNDKGENSNPLIITPVR